MASETELERMVIRLIGDAENYRKMLEESEKKTKEVADKITAQGKRIEEIGGKFKKVGGTLTKKLTIPLASAGLSGVLAFSNFDKKMTESTAIMKVTEDQVAAMKNQALDLAVRGTQGPAELAESYFFLASAGFDAAESMKALPIVAQFATAGNFDMAKATDLLTDALSALGKASGGVEEKMANMSRLGDLLVAANTMANASVEQFSTALTTKAGTAMKSFNIETEQGLAVLAAFADQGIKAELAGNAFDRMLRLLNKAGQDNAKAWEEMQFSAFKANGEFKDMSEMIRNLEQVTEGLGTRQKAVALTQLGFQARVQSAILPLLGTSDAIESYTERLRAMRNMSEEVSRKQMKSFSNQLKLVSNRLKVAAIGVGETLAPMLEKLGKIIASLTEKWGNLSKTTRQVIVLLGAVAAALGPVLILTGIMITSTGKLIGLYAALKTALGVATAAQLAFNVAMMAGKASILGAGIAITIGLAKIIHDNLPEVKAFNAAIKESATLSQQLIDKEEDLRDTFFEELDAMDTLKGKRKAVTKEMKRQNLEIDGLKKRLVITKKAADDMAPTWRSLWQSGRKNWEVTKDQIAELETRLQTANRHIGELVEEQKFLEEQTSKQAEASIKGETAANEFIKSMEKQAEAVGKTARQMKLLQIQQSKASLQSILRAIDAAKHLENLEKEKELQEELQSVREKINEAIDTRGMTKDEAELFRLRQKGASEVDLAQIKFIQTLRRQGEEMDALKARGKQLTEAMLTPAEKQKKKLLELNKLLAVGAIDKKTFARAKKEIDKLNTTVKIDFSVTGIDAVESGTAAALARVQGMQDALRFRKQQLANNANIQAVGANTPAPASSGAGGGPNGGAAFLASINRVAKSTSKLVDLEEEKKRKKRVDVSISEAAPF